MYLCVMGIPRQRFSAGAWRNPFCDKSGGDFLGWYLEKPAKNGSIVFRTNLYPAKRNASKY